VADFEVEVQLASAVDERAPGTVGIVGWSIGVADVVAAEIQFGLDTNYGTVAPVDLDEPGFRTLLLGMKPKAIYHFRILARDRSTTYESRDYEIQTGPAMAADTLAGFEIFDESGRDPGFIVTSFWSGAGSEMVIIVDPDGDIVWSYDVGASGIARAALSADGRHIWIVLSNPNGGPLARITLDGLDAQVFGNEVASHDIAPVVGDTMAFLEYGEDDCDSLYEIDGSGATREVFELSDYVAEGGFPNCHANAVGYSRNLDTFVFSSLLEDVFLIPREGGEVRQLSQIVPGGNATWGGTQHGVQLLGGSILLYANDEGNPEGGFNSGGPSTVLEYALDDGRELWRYEGDEYTSNLGGVQRLPNGNTLVTHSNEGIIREVDASGQTILEITSGGGAFGYSSWRSSLYGAPPDIAK
jgi:hypothetical protein